MSKKDWKSALKKKARKDFTEQLERLGFKQTEMAILLSRTPRCVSFYLSGERNIPTAIQVKMHEIEKTDREELCRVIVAVQQKRKRLRK